MKKLYFFLFLFTASIGALFSQTYQLTGKISTNTGQPIEAVTIWSETAQKGSISSQDGEFSLSLDAGVHQLEFHHLAYTSVFKTVDLNRPLHLEFKMQESAQTLAEVSLRAVRVDADSPITHSNMDKEALEERNLGQDLPILMNFLPSVVTTTDAGAGVGYTGIRVRGSDATRVNVTLNGIPYNDSESQGTFWVNMPDFTSSVEDLQLQRGVGTSTNGSGAFGASLNIQTDAVSDKAYASLANSYGSFNTWKHTAKFSTGLLNENFEMAGRLSKIKSDGYIDRAFSDLTSYYLHGAYTSGNTMIKAITFGGEQQTYQAWNGVDAETMKTNRRFNSAGLYYDEDGNMKFYDNETDNYKQTHYQLHWNQRFDHRWSSHLALNFTQGQGYFEQYRQDDKFSTYGMIPYEVNGELIDKTDLVRRRWLDNNFFVVSSNVSYKTSDLELIMGGFFSHYTGDHFGEVIWAKHPSQFKIGDRYYFSDATKSEYSLFAKLNYNLSSKWKAFVDLQGRFVSFKTQGLSSKIFELDVDKNFSFFNPKLGLSYQLSPENQFYVSYARAHREPNRQDFEEDINTAEELDDIELGWRFQKNNFALSSNLYYMYYQNQLVLTGELDNSGRPVRMSSGKSYRLGLELDMSWELHKNFSWMANATLSTNKHKDFVMDWDGELTNFGDTDLSFSPRLIASNMFVYSPIKDMSFGFLSKYVGSQYMGNTQTKSAKLDAYTVSDLQMQYSLSDFLFTEKTTFSVLVNNIFDKKYSSNGFYYTFDDDYTTPGVISTQEGAGYYPQAGINFLVGINMSF